MDHFTTSGCQCEDELHHGRECLHPAKSFQMTGGEPVSVCACCAKHKHMTLQHTSVPEAEQKACASG